MNLNDYPSHLLIAIARNDYQSPVTRKEALEILVRRMAPELKHDDKFPKLCGQFGVEFPKFPVRK